MNTLPAFTRRGLVAGLSLAAAALLQTAPALAQTDTGTRASLAARIDLGCSRLNPELLSCREDASTAEDRAELDDVVRSMFRSLPDEDFDPAEIGIRYLGKVRQVPEAKFVPNERESTTATTLPRTSRVTAFRAISPRTGNEFEIDVPRAIRDAFDRVAAETGANRENRGAIGLPDSREGLGPIPRKIGGPVANALGGGTDSRVILPGNSTTFPWVAIANTGGCTATFIGPRHLVTAAHCLYNRTTASFSSQYTIQPGRTATSVPYQTTIPGAAGTGKSWIFVPPQWMQANPAGGTAQYDFGIMVTPDRLANQFGHLGYGTLSSGALRDQSLLLRGYPWCESESNDNPATAANEERIDEPDNIDAASNGVVPNAGRTCSINAFYGGDACTVGSFSVSDSDGWSRRVTHSCDASAANSGSSLYSYVDGFGAFVSMVHTTSLKCAFVGQASCTAADTHLLEATRMTPEYTGWVSWFRNAWQ